MFNTLTLPYTPFLFFLRPCCSLWKKKIETKKKNHSTFFLSSFLLVRRLTDYQDSLFVGSHWVIRGLWKNELMVDFRTKTLNTGLT